MFRHNLFKRTLPILLSVAMVLQSVPLTAMAAESEIPEVTAESAIDEVADDMQEADGDSETDMVDFMPESEDVTSNIDSQEETQISEAEENNTGENQSEENSADVASDDGEDGVSAIDIDYVGIQSGINKNLYKKDYSYDAETRTIISKYSKNNTNSFEEIFDNIQQAYISVIVDNDDRTELLGTYLEYKWQKKNSDGKYSDLTQGEFPANAGDYKLIVSLPKVEGVCESATAEINFRIDKASIEIKYKGSNSVAPGTIAADAKTHILDSYTFSVEGVAIDKTNRDAYVANNAVVIRNAYDKSEVNDSDKLLKTGDYTLELTVELKAGYKDNYEMANNLVPIEVEAAIETEIRVTSKKSDGSDIGKVYDGQAITEDELQAAFEAEVIAYTNDGEQKIDDAFIKYSWLDADENELVSNNDVKDAGTYYYVLNYEGQKGQYQSSEYKLKVVIQTADIIIDPQPDSEAEYYEDMTVAEALKAVTGYKVYPVVNNAADETKPLSIDEYFWGVSYNQSGKTQSYEPVFAIQKGTTNTIEDEADASNNKTVITWETLDEKDILKAEKNISYRIVFSGKKSVYDRYGNSSLVDINASQENYRVDCSDDALVKYAKDITVISLDSVEIDVSEMLDEFKAGESFENATLKTYDGKQIFTKRNEYKKASVKKDGTTLATGTDSSIKYSWQYLTGYETINVTKDEEGNPIKDDQGNLIDENGNVIKDDGDIIIGEDGSYKKAVYKDYYYYGYEEDVENTSTPSVSGDYRIEVSYNTKQYHAQNKYVYYTIQKKNVKVLLDEIPQIKAYAGEYVSDFIDKINYTCDEDGTRTYVKHSIVGGSVVDVNGVSTFVPDDEPVNIKEWRGYWDDDTVHWYTLNWHVERLVKEGADKGSYERIDNGRFIKGEEYRLCVEFGNDLDGNYYNYARNYNNRYGLDKHNERVIDSDGNIVIAYENDTKSIEVYESQGKEINIDIDWSKVDNKTKVYDGKSLSMDEIKEAVVVTNVNDGSRIPAEDVNIIFQWKYDYDYSSRYVSENNAVHVGDYYLSIIVEQDDEYAAYSRTYDNEEAGDKKFTIVPRKLTVTPVLKDQIKAGTYINGYNNIRDLCAADPIVTGYEAVANDAQFFEESKIQAADSVFIPRVLYYNLELPVYEKNAKQQFNGYLRNNRKYNVAYNGSLRDYYDNDKQILFYARDYEVVFETVAFTPIKDVSDVVSTEANNITRTRLCDDISGDSDQGYTHTITAREGIGYSQDGYYYDKSGEQKLLQGNYFVFKITAPKEYTNAAGSANKVVYENSIKEAGGYVLGAGINGNRAVYTLAFDASNKDKKTFEIIWEEGYNETFVVDFTNCILEDDLSKAVAPKSLAFNGAVTKMTIDESQQLDLKITKKQMGDIICIMYESDDDTVVNVSDTGYITALKKGTATVTAFPAYEVDGKKEKLTDAKGAVLKGAKVKITVSDVTAVKSIKVEAHDTYAYLVYAKPTAGYRREVYVLESSKTDKKTANDFETAIKTVSNGNYEAFAAKPGFIAKEINRYNSKGVEYYYKIENLKPDKQYTVYVRNVSALRTMDDGNKVAASYAGALSTFTTTKAQEIELDAYFGSASGVKYNEYKERYEINISAKKAQVSVNGRFFEKYSQNYSDEKDYVWRSLPLSKSEQSSYVNPNLTYYVTDYLELDDYYNGYYYNDPYWKDKSNKPILIGSDDNDNGVCTFIPVSKLASIDKKGNISLKGIGWVYVIVYNADTKDWDYEYLYITAAADDLTGKNIKLKVGNQVHLIDYLTYKQGKIKLSGYGYCNSEWEEYGLQDLKIDTKSNEHFDIRLEKDSNGVVKDCVITAKKASGKEKLTIPVTDNVAGKTVNIVVQSTEIDPVKSLKAKDVVDKFGNITFTYSANNDDEEDVDGNKLAFRIEVKDSTGKIMQNKLINPEDIRVWNPKYYGYADAKKTMYQYECKIGNLTRLSNYNVSVTAVYGDNVSKAVSTKIKTTNIPASYANTGNEYDEYYSENGTNVNVGVNKNTLISLSEYPILKSGNTYTLSLSLDQYCDNPDARMMKTDTLTWKSSNTKAATIKANQGTYTAALKAVKKGQTTISVTSKITKKVIAKWTVVINAVGEAGGYYGDNVLDKYGYYFGDGQNIDELGADVLTCNNSLSIELKHGEGKWIVFTAPAYGNYNVNSTNSEFVVYNGKLEYQGVTSSFNEMMEKGEKYYFYIENANRNNASKVVTISAWGQEYATVTMDTAGTKVKGGSYIIFTAPEDNYYTFTYEKNNSAVSKEEAALYKGERHSLTVPGSSIDEYVIKVTSRTAAKIAADTDIQVKFDDNGEAWYAFKADVTGRYTIKTDNAQKSVEASLFETLVNEYGYEYAEHYDIGEGEQISSNNVQFETQYIDKDQTVYIRLTSEEKDNSATLRVSQAKTVTVDNPASVNVKDDDVQYVTFAAPSDGDYRFTCEYTEVEGLEIYIDAYVNDVRATETISSNVYEYSLKKGELVTFEIWSEKVSDTEEPLSADVSIKAEKISITSIVLGVETPVVEVSDQISEWMTFTAADGDGWYNFNFNVAKNADETVPNVNAGIYGADRESYKDYVSGNGNEKFAYTEYLAAGEVRTIRLASDIADKAKVSVIVTKEAVLELTSGTPYDLEANEIKRLKWTAAKEGMYNFVSTVTPEEGEITIKHSDALKDEGRSITNLDSLSGYMSKGDTFYLTLTAGDAKVTFKADIKEQTVTSLITGPNPIELEPGEEKWVEFTARKTARYEYKTEDADGFIISKCSSLEDPYGDELPPEGEPYFAGQKQLFKIQNTNETKKTVKLTISDVVPKDVTLQIAGTASIKHGEGQWFRFKADDDKSGRYQFSVEAKSGDKEVNSLITIYTDNLLSEGEYPNDTALDYRVIKAGAYVYIYATASYDSDDTTGNIDITLKASKMTASETLTVNTEKELNLKADETVYLSFTAAEKGKYTFIANAGDNSMLNVEYCRNLGDFRSGSTNFLFTPDLEVNDNVIIKLTSYVEQNVKVKINKETLIEVTSAEKEYEVKDGDVLWFTVRASENCRYFVEAFDVADGMTLYMTTVSGPTGYNVGNRSGQGFYYSFVGNVGGELIFKVTASVDNGEAADNNAAKKFKIKSGLVETETIETGESIKFETSKNENGYVAPNHMVWYSFVPKEAGRYSIKAGGETSARVRVFTYSISASSGDSISSLPYETIINESQVGKEIVYAVYYTSADAKAFNFSVNKVTQKELSESSPVDVDITKVEARERVWVHFTSPADGRYTFTNDSKEFLATSFYKSIDENITAARAFSWDDEVCMNEGDEILFAAWYSQAQEASFKISVSSVKPDPLTVSDTDEIIEFNDNSAKWFEFTAPNSAIYKIDVTAQLEDGTVSNVSIYRYAKLNDQNGVRMYSGDTFGIEENSKVYIKLQPTTSLPEDVKLNVSIQITKTTDITKLNLSENPDIEVGADSEKWLCYTSEKAGFYKFAKSGSVDIYIYNDVNASYGEDWDGSEFEYALNKGESIYFKLVNGSEESASAAITVSLESEIKELAVNSSDNIGSMTSNDEAWYVFTAPEEGMYNISAGNNYAKLGIYTDPNSNYFDSYNGEYLNRFSKGEDIYIRVYTNLALEDITISCATVIEKEFSGEDKISFVLGEGEIALVKWTADSSGYYNVSYSADSRVRFKFTNEGYSSIGSSNSYSYSLTAQRGNGCELRLESNNRGNRITVSAAKTLRSLYLGSTTTVELDGNDSETLEFSAPDDGDYIFLSEGAESEYANLYDSNGNHLAYGNIGSGENNNFRIICNLKAYEKVRLEVHNVDWYSANCDIMVYRYIQNEATVNQNGYTQEISIASSQEVWLKLTAEEDGFYEFSCDYYNIDMTLYEMNDDDLGDVLGSDYTIKTWLDAGTTVMLRTYYYSHSSGTYTIAIEPGEITEVEGNWTIYSSSGTSSRNLSFESGCEAVISCTFNTGGVYTFYSEDEDVVIELYVNDEDSPKVSGNSIKFEYDPDEIRAVTMRIHKGTKYQAFNGYIYYSYEYAHKEYELTLGTPQEVSVPSDSEAWFNFTAPKAGLYKFSSSESYIYKSLYDTNGELLGSKSNTSDDIERYLDEGQQVQLKTYYSSHAECTYTISVSEAEVISLTPGSNEEKELPYGETQWYSFTADSDAEYEFEFRNNSSGYVYVYLYESLGADSNLDYRNIYSNNSYNSKKELTTDQTIYWKVVSAISPVADITIKMKKVEDVIIPLEDENGNGVTSEIYKNSTQWYSFTSEEDMIYVFTFTGDNTSTISAYLYEDKERSYVTSISLYSSDEFKKIERYIEAGATVFWKVSNSDYNAADANITIKAEKRHIEEISDGQNSVSIASGKDHLFKYTADESTRYIFTFTSTSESGNTPSMNRYKDLKLDSSEASISWTSSGTDENNNYVYTGISECYIQEGETVYWKVNNSVYYGNDVNISAKVEKLVINKWPETAEDVPVSVAPNEEKWYRYTAAAAAVDEKARYTFTFEFTFGNGGSYSYCKAYLYEELGSDSPVDKTASYSSTGVYPIKTECCLMPGQTIYWKIKNTNSSSAFNVDMKAEKLIVNDLTLTGGSDNANENEFEVAANAEQWLKFTSEEDARYTFTFTADKSNSYCKPYLYKALDADTNTTFDPAYSSSNYVNLRQVNDRYIGTESWYVPKDTTVYWKIENTNSSSPVKGTIKIGKIEVIDFTQDITDTGIEMDPGDERWIRYTADQEARYRFIFKSNRDSTIGAYLYGTLDAESKMNNNSFVTFNNSGASYDYYLESENEIYWKVSNYYSMSMQVNLEVVPVTTEELMLGGDGKVFSIGDDNDHRWITFKVPETGIYSFKIDCSSSVGYLEKYVDLTSARPEMEVSVSANSNSTNTIQYSLEAGRTVYLRVRRNGLGSAKFEVTLQVEQIQTAQTLIPGTGSEVSIDVNTAKYQWLEFTATEDGFYKFYSEGESDPKAWFFFDSVNLKYSSDADFYADTYNDNSGKDSNFSKRLEMQAGQTIYVLVGASNLSVPLETIVYIEPIEVKKLELGTGISINVETGDYVLLEFTALSDGTYKFYSDDKESGDPKAWFLKDKTVGYDAGQSALDNASSTNNGGYGSDDDSAGNSNFTKEIPLTEGQSIYIAAGAYNLGSSSYTIYAEKLEVTEE